MLLSISWRNVWRNKLRSTIIISAIAIGLTASIFMTSFYRGMANQRIEKAIRTDIAHIQIHNNKFRENNDINMYIPEAVEIASKTNSFDSVKGVSARIISYSVIASAETSAGVKISGVSPEEETRVTDIQDRITEGIYLNEGKKYPIIISNILADKLKVRLGSKVILTMQDINNNIVSGAFRITGLFDTKTKSFDESIVFITFRDASSLIGLPAGAAHEIAIRTTGNEQIKKVYDKVNSDYNELEVLTWSELSPELWFLTETMNYLMYILFVIILMALLFGLVNTMLMVVLERKREIGILMAVGLNKVRIFTMIVYETVFLALTGGFSGVLAGTLISKYFETHMIDLSKMGNSIEDMGFDSLVNTSVDLRLIVIVTILVFMTGILGSLFPAFRALKNNPSETIRTE